MVAAYSVAAPPGGWNVGYNGSYNIQLEAGQVRDTTGNFAAGMMIGAINVAVQPPANDVLAFAGKKTIARTASSSLATQNTEIVYQVNVGNASKVTFGLSGQRDVVSLELLDSQLQPIQSASIRRALRRPLLWARERIMSA